MATRPKIRWGVAAFYTVALAYCLWVWSLIFRLLGEAFA